MYEATIGRFFSADPIGIEASDRNFYRYAGNDPTNHEDPSGLDPQTCPTTGGSSDEEFHFKPPNARGLPKGPLVYKMSCWADKDLTFRYLAIGSPQWGSLTADRRSYVIGRQHHAASEGRKAVCIERNAKFLPESVVRKICEVSQERQQLLKETDWDRFFTSGVSSCEALIPPKAPFPPIPKPHPQFTTAIQPNCPASGVAPAAQTCKLSFVEGKFEPSFVAKYVYGDTPERIRIYYSPDTPENRDIACYLLRLKKLGHGIVELKKDTGTVIEVADAGARTAFDAVDNADAVLQFVKKPCWQTSATVFIVVGSVGVSTSNANKALGDSTPPPKTAPDTPPLKGEFRGRMINVETRKINLRNGDPNVTGSGIEYAWKNHGGGGANSKSQFTISKDALKKLLQEKNVIDSPIRPSGTTGNYIREVDVCQTVGKLPVNKGGTATSVITVITDVKGNIVNVFPGALGRSATLP